MKEILLGGRFFRSLLMVLVSVFFFTGCFPAKNGKTWGIFSHMSSTYELDQKSKKRENRQPSLFQVVVENRTGVPISIESVAYKGASYEEIIIVPAGASLVVQVRPEPAGGYSYHLEIELGASAPNSQRVVYRSFSFDHHSNGYDLYSGRQIHHWVITARDFVIDPNRP